MLAALGAGTLYRGVGASSATVSPATTRQSAAGHYDVATVEELQTAVAQLTSAGGTINLRAGDYVLDHPLDIRAKSTVQLIGAGWDCRIIRRGDGDVLRLVDAGFCVIRNLLVLGAPTGYMHVLRPCHEGFILSLVTKDRVGDIYIIRMDEWTTEKVTSMR